MATVTRSEFESARLRQSQEDYKRILQALDADGTLTVEDDPAPPDPEPVLDDEGNPVEDEEGNPVLQVVGAPAPATTVAIQVDAEDEAAEETAAEAEEETE